MAPTTKKKKKLSTAIATRAVTLRPPANSVIREPSLLEAIGRAAADPRTDVSKMERLLEMARSVRAEDAKAAFIRAMVKMKPLLPVIDRNGCIMIHEKGKDKVAANLIQSTPYALWEDIDEAITPILAEHGFVLTFRTGTLPDGKVNITGVLSHEMGHEKEAEMALPLDTSGSKNNAQAAGSSTKYGMRYTATALLNIRTKGQDDDGVAAGSTGLVSDEQAETILGMLTRDKADVTLFCKSMKIDSIVQLPASRYREAVERINTRSQIVKQKEPTQ